MVSASWATSRRNVLWRVSHQEKIRPPVGVRLALDDRVMDAMHAGRDDDAVERAFDGERQTPVGMVKERCRFEDQFEDEIEERSDSENQDDDQAKWDRENDFSEVKARRGAHIEIEVGMVDVVKAPEKRDSMYGTFTNSSSNP